MPLSPDHSTASVRGAGPRRFRRVAAWIVTIVLLAIVVLRLALAAALPWLLRQTYDRLGVQGRCERVHLSLLTGQVQLWNLVLYDRDPNTPLLHLEYCRAAVSPRSLWRGRLAIGRVEVDGLHVTVRRDPNDLGTDWDPVWVRLQPPARVTSDAAEAPVRSSWEPPLELKAVRLQQVELHWVDPSVAPDWELTVRLHARLSNFGSRQQPLTYSLDLTAQPGLDHATLEGTGRLGPAGWDGRFGFDVQGFHPDALAGLLGRFGLESESQTLALQGQGSLQLAPLAAGMGARGRLRIDTLSATADHRRDVSVRGLDVVWRQPSRTNWIVEDLRLNAGHIDLQRDAAGRVRCLGLALGAQPGRSAPPPDRVATPVRWAIAQAQAQDLTVTWQDWTVPGGTQLVGTLRSLTLENTTAPDGRLNAVLAAPGTAEQVHLAGTVQLAADRKTWDLKLDVGRVTLGAWSPYLQRVHLRPTLQQGRLQARLRGQWIRPDTGGQRVDLAVTDVRFHDDRELYRLDRLVVDDLHWANGEWSLGRLERQGERLPITRSPTGLELLGLNYHPDQGSTRATTVEPNEPLARKSGLRKRILIGQVVATDQQIILFDERDPNHPVEPLAGGLDLHLDNVAIDFNRPDAWMQPGQGHLRLSVPGLVEELTADATVGMEQGELAWTLHLSGRGIQGARLAPYTELFGVVPTVEQGRLRGDLHGRLVPGDDGFTLTATLQDFSWADANDTQVTVPAAAIRNLRWAETHLSLEAVEIRDPAVELARDPNGRCVVAGFALTGRGRPATPTGRAPPTWSLDRLAVTDARIHWRDDAVAGGVDITAVCNLAGQSLGLGDPNREGRFTIDVTVDDVVSSLRVEGSSLLGRRRGRLETILQAAGVNGRALEPYAPAGWRADRQDGRVDARLEMEWAPGPADGLGLLVRLRDLQIQDGNETWLALPRLELAASQWNPGALRLTLDRLHAEGLRGRLEKRGPDRWGLLGWSVGPAASAATGPAAEPNDTSAPVASEPSGTRPAPRIVLQDLLLAVDEFVFQNVTEPNSVPLVLRRTRLTNDHPVWFTDELVDVNNPITLTLAGQLPPLAASFTVHGRCQPFADQQTARVTWTCEGLEGDALVALLGPLGRRWSGHNLHDGRFSGRVQVSTSLSRRAFADFDLARPFGLHLEVEDLRLTQGTGEALLGFQEFLVDAPHIDLGQGRIQIGRVEWTEPQAVVRQTDTGLELAGLTLLAAPATAAPPVATRSAPAAGDPNAVAEPIAVRTLPPGGPWVTCEEVLVSGLDLRFFDQTVDPAVQLPLNDLGLELRGLSNRFRQEPTPIRFTALLSADRVPVAAGTVPDPNDPNATVVVWDPVPLLEEATCSGQLTLGDSPQGWIKAGVTGLDLRALEGWARRSDFSLRNGLLDARLDVRVRGDGKAPAALDLILTDLSLAESANATLTRRLALSAPLDVVLLAIRDLDGAIRLKPRLTLDVHDLEARHVSQAFYGAVGALMMKAFATSPFKPVSTVAGLLGAGRQGGRVPDPVTLSYPEGTLTLSAEQQQRLRAAVQVLQRDRRLTVTLRHHLGLADLVQAERLANPSLSDRRLWVLQLEQGLQALRGQRAEQAARTEAAYRLGDWVEAQRQTETLRTLQSRLTRQQQALDDLLESLRPGSPAIRTRRTRQAALQIGQERLRRLQGFFAQAGIAIDGASSRVNLLPARYERRPDQDDGRVTLTFVRKR